MSLNWKLTTARSFHRAGLAVATLVCMSPAFAQDKPAPPTTRTIPLSNKETPGPAKATTDKTKSDPSDFKEAAPAGGGRRGRGGEGGDKDAKPEKTAYDYELPGADGKGVPLSGFKGKTLVVVNLARNSSYNSQLPALEKLADSYKDKGVVVIGVPSDEFGAAEPGKDAEIQKAYQDAKVTFPVMAKSTITGDSALPFYVFATGKGAPEGGPVHWNYTKFIVDKTGKVTARFGSDVTPDSNEFLSVLDQVLDGSYKPKKAGGPGGGEGGGGGDGPPS
ncbi:glutathione peroxidase [Granulicella rosea]|uniref:Glutathione peroxidase n=1 Tax=Granulicella rosea TaxID=474952 RepID=A0A239LXE8_9BACT|nr:glutathione peroxidase [Granulicella rosea]SNT35337.1 glutathione peroxidase [Granulicella rosea]